MALLAFLLCISIFSSQCIVYASDSVAPITSNQTPGLEGTEPPIQPDPLEIPESENPDTKANSEGKPEEGKTENPLDLSDGPNEEIPGNTPTTGEEPNEETPGNTPTSEDEPEEEKTENPLSLGGQPKKENWGNTPNLEENLSESKLEESSELEETGEAADLAINKSKRPRLAMAAPMMLGATPYSDPPGEDPTDPTQPDSGKAHGSGSYQLNENKNDYRFYTEYFVDYVAGKSITTAGIQRKTVIKVYAKAGERILFGSSVYNSQINAEDESTDAVTGADIVIKLPGGGTREVDVLRPGDGGNANGSGYIQNPTQEQYGPVVNTADMGNSNYYVPCVYEVPENGEGIYTFEFHSVTGKNDGIADNLPKPKKAGDGWDQGKTSVAAWDVTVLGKASAPASGEGDADGSGSSSDKWEVKEGRAWADYLALTTGAASTTTSDLNLHVLSHDGYLYKVDFNQAVPYGFIFFANNTGFMTKVADGDKEEYHPVYHSFYDSTNDLEGTSGRENIYLHNPDIADDTAHTLETHKIFFNRPSDDLKDIGILTAPVGSVELSNLKFSGIGDNLASTGQGGHFTFHSNGEAMVTIRLDLRKAIFESEGTMGSYDGSGIVEITEAAHEGDNSFYWDGKDTDGVVIPSGIYGNNNVVLSTEVKRGEIHFPIIDMEGLYGGLHIERLNGENIESEERYNLYYNNNPLAYGTIEGPEHTRVTKDDYDILTDGTKSYKLKASLGGNSFFNKYDQKNISTYVKDTKEYLSEKFFNSSYEALSSDRRAIIDAEFGSEQPTYHFEPIDSNINNPNSTMLFSNSGNSGGGNQAGIDAWTYYSNGVVPYLISFAILDSTDKGMVRGQIFYDANKNATLDTESASGDYLLKNVKVRLIDSNGKPLVHDELLPCFDDAGYFVYNEDGTVKHELKSVKYETTTDASGNYRFVGVPYSSTEDTTYYVQVLLSDVQSEVLRYTCTTSKKIQEEVKTKEGVYFLPLGEVNIDTDNYGADGNEIVPADYDIKIYGRKYNRDTTTNETVFSKDYAQFITFSPSDSYVENGVRVKDFKKIGYCTAVPEGNRKDYTVEKIWGEGTHKISDGLTVELWVWNDSAVKEENALNLSRRTGALMDTQVLGEDNHWTYTWKDLDDRLQYYILEYYTKKKADGEIIYNDKGEPRKVLIGGTMPIFSTIPTGHNGLTYGFATNLGDYPETIPDPADNTKTRVPIQRFDEKESKTHTNSITKTEKLESVDNNARQYNVTYTLSDEGGVNTIKLTNSQVYDDRTYYVWLGHETVLPGLIAQTYVESGVRKDHALTLEKDLPINGTGEYTIKGLSVSSIDAAQSDNIEGNATKAFRIADNGTTNALFTATNQGNYKTGTGTRTYQVKYVVDQDKHPVSVKADETGKLVLTADSNVKVEAPGSNYIVYTWYMTIHVYDVVSDGVFEYDPNGGEIKLQDALAVGGELSWTLSHDGNNYNSITYTSDDSRESGILKNDIYRLPLYKSAVNPHMGSCADFVGIAYAGSSPVNDVSGLVFEDTYHSVYGVEGANGNNDGTAIAHGNGGYVSVILNTLRNTRINRTQDHANYAAVSFTPSAQALSRMAGGNDDVFYYKIVVFAEDNTYKNYKYEDIDATEGVVMYTYFTMRPKQTVPEEKPEEKPDDKPNDKPDVKPDTTPKPDSKPKPDNTPEDTTSDIVVERVNTSTIPVVVKEIPVDTSVKMKTKSPKTGDDSHMALWASLVALGVVLTVIGAFKKKLFVGLLIVLGAGSMLLMEANDYHKAAREYKEADKIYVSHVNTNTENTIVVNTKNKYWENLIDVDIDGLRSKNSDIAGWIFFENEDISYPIVNSGDNIEYLRKTYDGKNAKAGSIFMDGLNKSDFSDAHTIIYGHNMKDLSMFGKLRYYAMDDDYILGHEFFQIITADKKYRYKIISYKVVADDSDVYTIYKNGGNDFETFVGNVLRGGSYYNNDVAVNANDHMITLSTCSNDDRLVVSAVRCDECNMK